MTLPLPAAYAPELTADRLQTVANWLLDELQATHDDLVRTTDTAWTKGCTTFGRQHSRIIAEWQSGRHSWLGLLDPSKALVFTIGGVPCRFSNDDPENPSKKAVLEVNPHQRAFVEFVAADRAVRFCFVVDRGVDGIADPYVVLHGLSEENVVLCRWVSDAVPAFRLEVDLKPAPVEVPKAKLGPKRSDPSEAGDRNAGDDHTSETM